MVLVLFPFKRASDAGYEAEFSGLSRGNRIIRTQMLPQDKGAQVNFEKSAMELEVHQTSLGKVLELGCVKALLFDEARQSRRRLSTKA
jgi:hypothetical protein